MSALVNRKIAIVGAGLVLVGALTQCATSDETQDSRRAPTGQAANNRLWTDADGPRTITCEDKRGFHSLTFGLPARADSDPVVAELNALLRATGKPTVTALRAEVVDHKSYPEADEADYLKEITLRTPSGTIELDPVKDGAFDALRETGLLSPGGASADKPKGLLERADALEERLRDENGGQYLVFQSPVTAVDEAFATFRGKGEKCSAAQT